MRLTRKQFLSDSPRVEDMEDSSWYRDNTSVESQVQIGDCSQKVYLNFDVNSTENLKKRLDKLDVLINNLQELKEKLPLLWDDAVKNAEAYKETNREKEDEKSVG